MKNFVTKNIFRFNPKTGVIIILSVVLIISLWAHSQDRGIKNISERREDSFEMKRHCAEYLSILQKEAESHKTANDFYLIKKIFYSPKANSCLYVLETETVQPAMGAYSLIDALTQEVLLTTKWSYDGNDDSHFDQPLFFDEKLKEWQ